MTAISPAFATPSVPGPSATVPARERALAELKAAGWPSRRRERWRYTDLAPLATLGYELAPAPADATALEAAKRLLDSSAYGLEARRFVLLDGRFTPALGAQAIDSVEVRDGDADWPVFTARFAGRIAASEHPLALLNAAFTQGGLWLRIPAETVVAAPIHIVVVGSPRATIAAQPRIVIEAQQGARATIVQHFVDCDPQASGWTNSVTAIAQEPRSHLELYRFQQQGSQHAHTSLLLAELDAQAELTTGYVDLGGRLVRNDIEIRLQAVGARTQLFGLFLAGADQHIDNHTLISHAAGATHSVEAFRGIIGRRGRGVFNGKVVVQRDCQGIDARQNSDNLLLAEQAEIDTKPELEIYSNDVKCAHGSTVGELDPEQLFYLRARGVGHDEARQMLTNAFAATVLEQFPDPTFRAQALEQAAARLRALTEA